MTETASSSISPDEIKEALGISDEDGDELRKLINDIDENGDGQVDYASFVAAGLNHHILLCKHHLPNPMPHHRQSTSPFEMNDNMK